MTSLWVVLAAGLSAWAQQAGEPRIWADAGLVVRARKPSWAEKE